MCARVRMYVWAYALLISGFLLRCSVRPKFVENPSDCVLHFGVGTRAAVLSVQCEAMQGCHLTYTWYHNDDHLESSGSGRLHFNE